jgi:hypothetical protein
VHDPINDVTAAAGNVGEQNTNMLLSYRHGAPARIPARNEEIWTREDLKEIMRNLSLLSEHGVREFYNRAYRECRIINSHTFPPARAVQELVQAWKQLRKWRRP